MSNYYNIRTQAPAQMGKKTLFDKSHSPWKVERLHAIFDVWSDDDLLKTAPCYYVTAILFEHLSQRKFSGIEYGGEIESDKSSTFENLYPGKMLPKFFLINIIGTAFKDDFGLDKSNKLIVSERAKEFLIGFNLSDSEIEEVQV